MSRTMDLGEEETALQRLERAAEVFRKLRSNIKLLLDQVGDRGACRGCSTEIWWVKLRSGKKGPYTADALNHFADCPAANRFKGGS